MFPLGPVFIKSRNMSKNRRERGKNRMRELGTLALANGMWVESFSRIHHRVHGTVKVDYWPTTGRAWVQGSGPAQGNVEPREVIELARRGSPPVVEYEAAKAHMDAIAHDDSPPPW